MKICSYCKKAKLDSNFAENKKCCNECREKHKQYYKNNKEKKNRYYQINKETRIKYWNNYRNENKCKIIEASRRYYHKNKKEIKIKNAQYYQNNKCKIIKRRKNNSKKIAKYQKQYRENNYEKIKQYQKKYQKQYIKEKLKTSPKFKLQLNLRRRLNLYLTKTKKTLSHVKDLGCSIDFLREHIEMQFYPHPITGQMMEWGNWGRGNGKWQIDHIKEFREIDMNNHEQLLGVIHFSNLQPLWTIDHVKKTTQLGNKQ